MPVVRDFQNFEQDAPMAGIIEFPQIVQDALEQFADVFANEPQRQHFADYLTGLMIAERKTVAGINREFAQPGDQSCLNRFLTEADWDVDTLNQRRLEILQRDPAMRYSAQGVIAIDNVLFDREGYFIPDASWMWDHADQRYKIAQDYLFASYVCTSGKHYPLAFRRFCCRERCACDEKPFVNHTHLCIELIDWVCAQAIPGDFTFDNYFTSAEILNHIQGKTLPDGRSRGYVGDLKFNRNLLYRGQTLAAEALAKTIAPALRKPVWRGRHQQWYFKATVRIPGVHHKVKVVLLWNEQNDETPVKILVTNRIHWDINRILRVYRHRWTGTETFHRDGKQELGLGACQLQDSTGHDRHVHLVMLAYSLLMQRLQQGRAWEWSDQKLTTIGQACRSVLTETLRRTLLWALEQVNRYAWEAERVVSYLNLTEPQPGQA
jgi:DDE superfamily endonuclease